MAHDPFITGRRMGAEGELLIIIDDFHPDPEALIKAASTQSYGDPGKFYPGVRAAADPQHLQPCQAVLAEVLSKGFGAPGVRLAESSYSLVTAAPDSLAPIQRIPHFDGTDPNRLALLHYLTGPEEAGTAFFRQRPTGFEIITEDRFATYKSALDEAYPKGPQSGYFVGGDDHFEQIDQVEAKYNRAVLYRGLTLHSGIIPEGFTFAQNPREGRLTINSFLEVKAR